MKGRCLFFVVCLLCLSLAFFSKLSDDSGNLSNFDNFRIPPSSDTITKNSLEETLRANQIIDFYNASLVILEKKIIPVPMHLGKVAEEYLLTWQLPEPEDFPDQDQFWDYLEPDKSFFDLALTERLNALAQKMKAAYGEIVSHYDALQKYVADKRILDDGKKGEELVSSIIKARDRFSHARQEWCQLVETEAEGAQHQLFSHHPFKQHVSLLKEMLNLFSETSALLAQGEIDRAQIISKAGQIRDLLDGKELTSPPITQIKDLYLSFLEHGKNFVDSLEQGISKGFFSNIKKEMNRSHLECISIYNDFVHAINAIPNKSIPGSRQ